MARSKPPDRSHLITEGRNPRSMGLHEMTAAQIVELLGTEDQAVLKAMAGAARSLTGLIEAAQPRFTTGGRLIYIGAGTSGRLGVLDASECPPTFQVPHGRVVGIIAGGDAALRKSSEAMEDDPNGARKELDALKLTESDTLVGITSGGTTPYVLGALEYACRVQPRGLRALIACTPMAKPSFVDHLVVLETGPELVTGSTRMKAGTATKLALNTLSTGLMVLAGRVHENLMVDMQATNDKLSDRAARIIAALTGLDRAACFDLLQKAGGSVKRAVVMHRRNISMAQAQQRLDDCGGWLHKALKE